MTETETTFEETCKTVYQNICDRDPEAAKGPPPVTFKPFYGFNTESNNLEQTTEKGQVVSSSSFGSYKPKPTRGTDNSGSEGFEGEFGFDFQKEIKDFQETTTKNSLGDGTDGKDRKNYNFNFSFGREARARRGRLGRHIRRAKRAKRDSYKLKDSGCELKPKQKCTKVKH